MSLASDTDLWMFVASGGGLTAGRVDANGSLFPYLTSDQLHDAHHHTGPLTLIRVEEDHGATVLWEPFGEASAERPGIERSLTKNIVGNRLVFEEIDHDLGLAFRYGWAACDDFGWVRSATLENRGARPVRASVLDGLRNILPWGAPLHLYQQASNLVDAYKKNEVDPATGLGIFALTAGITDRAEALEVLRANTVWCCGLDDLRVSLSLAAVAAFRHGRIIPGEAVLNGRRGNYLVTTQLDLEPGQIARWHLAADVGRDHVQIADLRRRLREGEDLADRIEAGLTAGRQQPAAQRRQRRRPATHRTRGGVESSLRQRAVQQHARRRLRAESRRARRRLRRVPARAQSRRGRPATGTARGLAGQRAHRGPPRRGARGRGRRSRAARPRVPSPVLRPAPRRPQPPLEPLRDPRARPRRRAGAALRGQLAGHLPELGGPRRVLPRLPAQHGGQVRQRVDRGRLQPLPHHPRRRGLGGPFTGRPLEQHRLLGGPPARLPAALARGDASPRSGRDPGASGRRDLQLRRGPLPHQALCGDPPGSPGDRRVRR